MQSYGRGQRPFSTGAARPQTDSEKADAMEHKEATYEQIAMRMLSIQDKHTFRKFILAVLGVFGCLVGGFWAFRDSIVKHSQDTLSDVAFGSLQSKQVQEGTQEALRLLLNDPRTMARATAFVKSLTAQPETQQALVELARRSLQDPETKKAAEQLAGQLLTSLIQDQKTLDQLTDLLRRAIVQETNKDALYILLTKLVHDPATHTLLTNLGKNAAHDILDDPAIRAHALHFLENLMRDKRLQQQGSEVVWATVKGAFFGNGNNAKPPQAVPAPVQPPAKAIPVQQHGKPPAKPAATAQTKQKPAAAHASPPTDGSKDAATAQQTQSGAVPASGTQPASSAANKDTSANTAAAATQAGNVASSPATVSPAGAAPTTVSADDPFVAPFLPPAPPAAVVNTITATAGPTAVPADVVTA